MSKRLIETGYYKENIEERDGIQVCLAVPKKGASKCNLDTGEISFGYEEKIFQKEIDFPKLLTSFDFNIAQDRNFRERELSLFFIDNGIINSTSRKETNPSGEFCIDFFKSGHLGTDFDYLFSFSGFFTEETKNTEDKQISGNLHVTIEKCLPKEIRKTSDVDKDDIEEGLSFANKVLSFLRTLKIEEMKDGKILAVAKNGTAVYRDKIHGSYSPTIMMIISDKNDPTRKTFVVNYWDSQAILEGIQEDGLIRRLNGTLNVYEKIGSMSADISVDISDAPSIVDKADVVRQAMKELIIKIKKEKKEQKQ